ncbi:uncharacterized protein LOC128268976 [Anopheles cruzii]|uniref:uncharacterized protein LOC128268976 n=1 Tax=Anopheles cruzii TaxID=68878 RepID=UPI0022EC7F41|nr:uncharacterized protein LOC128268976 [Anopheles cruzii]
MSYVYARHNNSSRRLAKGLLVLATVLQTVTTACQAQRVGDREYKPEMADLYITVNARTRTLELAWRNFDDLSNYILLAERYPVPAFQPRYYYYTRPPGASTSPGPPPGDDAATGSSSTPEVTTGGGSIVNDGSTTENSASSAGPSDESGELEVEWDYDFRDEHGVRKKEVLFSVQPIFANGWTRTDIKFNYDLMKEANTTTGCYGYYGYFVSPNGTVLDVHCMKLYPTWMNDLRSHLSGFRVKELFLPGTHDSASYKHNFDPQFQENIVSKYALTQDDDIRSQLLLGVRYIDLRVGYYKSDRDQFWANHGISRMHPLAQDLEQIRRYALETKEIIVVDVQEFPVGFGKGYDVHLKLIDYLQRALGDVMAAPGAGWSRTLGEIWAGGKTVLLAYDNEFAARAFPEVLWRSVQQRWGNVQKVNDLKNYLFKVHHPLAFREYSYRPVADMAELTPDPWGVITDRYGGLRKMADSVNRFVTKWYFEDLGPTANVVAVDFLRGTSIVDAAIYWNLKRVPSVQ